MRNVNGFILLLASSIVACTDSENSSNRNDHHIRFTQYSEFVKDTFYIDVQLPEEYQSKPQKNYPVVVLLDGNFYYPIMSAIVLQYENAGLLQPVILVGVGYKSFKVMDSLRVRDYLFPKALASDEMEAVGGAQNFFNYLEKELLHNIDARFRTEKQRRTLAGHSFGGYFVLYSLLNQTSTGRNDFQNFIAASPSLWYNNFYLNQLPGQLGKTQGNVGLFMSVGDLEDSTWSVKPVVEIAEEIRKTKIPDLKFTTRVYNHLEHMDVAILSFTKGLQEFYSKEN